jgi:hypothetical protein
MFELRVRIYSSLLQYSRNATYASLIIIYVYYKTNNYKDTNIISSEMSVTLTGRVKRSSNGGMKALEINKYINN